MSVSDKVCLSAPRAWPHVERAREEALCLHGVITTGLQTRSLQECAVIRWPLCLRSAPWRARSRLTTPRLLIHHLSACVQVCLCVYTGCCHKGRWSKELLKAERNKENNWNSRAPCGRNSVQSRTDFWFIGLFSDRCLVVNNYVTSKENCISAPHALYNKMKRQT